MLPNSPDLIHCQTCATAWPQSDSNGQYYFRGVDPLGTVVSEVGSYTNPAEIIALGVGSSMTFCPACDTELLEATPIPNSPPGVVGRDPFYHGDDKMIRADVDAPAPDSGDADVTHRFDPDTPPV